MRIFPGLVLPLTLKLIDAIKPLNRFGANFVDFFTMTQRLATVGKEGISFYEFWSRKGEYQKKRYIQNIIESYKKRGSNQNKIQIFR